MWILFSEDALYRTMEGYMFGWKTNPRDRTILSHYRGRNRTMWSDEQRNDACGIYGNGYSSSNYKSSLGIDNDDDEDIDNFNPYLPLSSRQEMNVMKNVSFSDDLSNMLRRITNSFDSLDHQNVTSEITSDERDDYEEDIDTIVRPACRRFAEEILEDSVPFTEDSVDEDNDDDERQHLQQIEDQGEVDIESSIERYLEDIGLSDDKSIAVNVMKHHFVSLYHGTNDDYKAPVLLVTGGPGVGKSFLVDVFDEVSKIIGVGEQLSMVLQLSTLMGPACWLLWTFLQISARTTSSGSKIGNRRNYRSSRRNTTWTEYQLLL